MAISLIFAMDRNQLIGANNDLPWYLPADLAYFRRTTKGHAVLMGRKTYESIGKPLPYRRNVIITRDPDYTAEGCEIVHSLEEALDTASGVEIFVIGGSEIYKQALPKASKLYITHIDYEFKGDRYFPIIPKEEWQLISEEAHQRDEKNHYAYTFKVYERVKPSSEL